MHSRVSFFVTILLILAAASEQLSAQSAAPAYPLTLQVGSFPNSEMANRFVAHLISAGEHPSCTTVTLQGRRSWTRVFVGFFVTSSEARDYGERLVARGLISEFLVKRAEIDTEATRPRRVMPTAPRAAEPKIEAPVALPTRPVLAPPREIAKTDIGRPLTSKDVGGPRRVARRSSENRASFVPLPVLATRPCNLAPRVDLDTIPRADPVSVALRLYGRAGAVGSSPRPRGGLWITGDRTDALARLRWIVGDENANLIRLDFDGRVRLDEAHLARAAGLGQSRVDDPVVVANYISSNEGLFLIVQLTEGRYCYRLHLGRFAPTSGKFIEISSSVNLDHNFDSRINPYRRQSKKLESELPPEGFDALVGLNPSARWYNLSTRSWVPEGEITFHELAEAFGKVELGLDYLPQGTRPGAHAVAIEREHILKTQRPSEGIVMTAGSNRVLRNQEEIRLFFADNPGGIGQR